MCTDVGYSVRGRPYTGVELRLLGEICTVVLWGSRLGEDLYWNKGVISGCILYPMHSAPLLSPVLSMIHTPDSELFVIHTPKPYNFRAGII